MSNACIVSSMRSISRRKSASEGVFWCGAFVMPGPGIGTIDSAVIREIKENIDTAGQGPIYRRLTLGKRLLRRWKGVSGKLFGMAEARATIDFADRRREADHPH